MQENAVIVTRFPALAEYIIEQGLCDPETPVVTQATPDDVAGRHVFGILPVHLAARAALITEIPIVSHLGVLAAVETIENVRKYARRPNTYRVERVDVIDN